MKYIIVQAGGKGTRLKDLTYNKPKALVSIKNKPMIFYLFDLYKDAKFIIIGDYKADVFKKYLKLYANVDYKFIKTNEVGTCAGIKDALKYIPNDQNFMLIWSDLILNKRLDNIKNNINYIGLSRNLHCRWSYDNKIFKEKESMNNGILGCFVFKNKIFLKDVPLCGEFVRYLSNKDIDFCELPIHNIKEVGTLISYDNENTKLVSRPFNKIEKIDNKIIKYYLTDHAKNLGLDEINWYKQISKYKDIDFVPHVFSYSPLTIEYIEGSAVYNFLGNDFEKRIIIDNLVKNLKILHSQDSSKDPIKQELIDVYFTKTIDRIKSVKSLIPFINKKYIMINNVLCINVFKQKSLLKKEIIDNLLDTQYKIIHGDITFSNSIVDKDLNTYFIDPRGYFGKTKLYGDFMYDYAKLYYSIKGKYDNFNQKKFTLKVDDGKVFIDILDNGYTHLADYFLEVSKMSKSKLDLMVSIVYLSLTSYAYDNYDSILGAFYYGIYLFNLYLNEKGSK